jgi:hypothetical protein
MAHGSGDGERMIPGPDGGPITETEHQRLHRLAVYCGSPPIGSTKAAVEFLSAGHDVIHLVGFHVRVADRLDATLLETLTRIPPEERPELIAYRPIAEHYIPLLREMVLMRAVDSFLTYLARLVALIFTTKPETLRSRSQVEVEYILSFNSMDELVRSLADDEVTRLAYLGMQQLAETLDKKMGLVLFPSPEDLQRAVGIIEIRNLLVHNGGTINHTFLKRMPTCTQSLGHQVNIGHPAEDSIFLAHSVLDIDARSRDQFGLPTFQGDPPTGTNVLLHGARRLGDQRRWEGPRSVVAVCRPRLQVTRGGGADATAITGRSRIRSAEE